MDSLIETFHIDLKIIIAQAVNFGVVLVVLYFFALKPLKKIMDERAKTIEDGINDAKINAETLKATKTEYEKIIRQAKNEAVSLFEDSKKEAEARKNEILENARQEVSLMIENSKKSLESEKQKILEDAKKEIGSLVIKITEKLLDKEVPSSFNEKISKELQNI